MGPFIPVRRDFKLFVISWKTRNHSSSWYQKCLFVLCNDEKNTKMATGFYCWKIFWGISSFVPICKGLLAIKVRRRFHVGCFYIFRKDLFLWRSWNKIEFIPLNFCPHLSGLLLEGTSHWTPMVHFIYKVCPYSIWYII